MRKSKVVKLKRIPLNEQVVELRAQNYNLSLLFAGQQQEIVKLRQTLMGATVVITDLEKRCAKHFEDEGALEEDHTMLVESFHKHNHHDDPDHVSKAWALALQDRVAELERRGLTVEPTASVDHLTPPDLSDAKWEKFCHECYHWQKARGCRGVCILGNCDDHSKWESCYIGTMEERK